MKLPALPATGQVRIWADGEPTVTALLLEVRDATIGGGVWEDLPRDGQAPIADFTGRSLDAMTLALRLERGVTGPSVERALKDLTSLSRPEPGLRTPGGVWVMGEVPHAYPKLLRLSEPQLGKRRYLSGAPPQPLRYYELEVTLTELVIARATAQATPRRTRDQRGKRRVRVVRTRAGDTLKLLAIAELGNVTRWRDLREWNPAFRKTDPDARLRAGLKVTIR